MKRTLLLLKSNRLKRIYAIPVAFLLLALLSISTAARAQVVYSMGDPSSASSLPGDVVYRMNYDGSGSTTITTGANAGLVQPGQIALDGNNNRLFVSELYLSGNVIKVLNATTGEVIRTITSANSTYIKAIEYDVVNDWLYYTTEGGDATVLTANDALFRVHADGTGSQTLATTLTKNPYKIDIDVAGNKVYVLDVAFSGRSIKTIDLANNNAVTSRGFATSLNSIYDFAIDKVNGYIYYLAEGGNALTLTPTDALRRQNLDGTDDVALITSIANTPYRLALDLGNNRAYVTDAYNATAKIIAVNLSNNTFSTALTLPQGTSAPVLADMAVPEQPKVTTAATTSVTSASATLAGNLVYGYGLNTERGVVYSSTNTTPTISDSKASMATNTSNGAYSASVTGLSPSTAYYARAYAINGAGTTYGAVVTFSTSSNDAYLSGLSISAGILTPAFSAGTISYTASVTSGTNSITVTPIRNNANASIKVNNTTVTSGSASGSISLNTGDNTITTIVTAQDGTTTKTYTLTVNRPKAAQTITFNTLPEKNYGGADFAPGATTTSGLTISYSSDNTTVATIVGGNIHIVGPGTANITASQAGDANNLAATNVVQSITVNNAAITVTATAATKIYGDADPSLTYTITTGALVGSDVFSGSLTRNAGVNVGPYAITQGSLALSSSKYILTFVSADLTINKRPITIQPAPASKVYGDAEPAGYPYYFRVGSLASSDGMTGSYVRQPGEIPGTYALSIGTKHPVDALIGTDQTGNYDITFIPENLTINKREITLQPAVATKVYGNADPGFPYYFRVGSIAPGEAMTGIFGRQAGEDAGTYTLNLGTKRPVNASTGTFTDQYYTISFLPADLTITKRTVNVSANAQNKAYGDVEPTLTYAADALGFGEPFSGTLTRAAGESPGTYAISQGTLALNPNNYDLNFTGSNLTIDKKTINVSANVQTKTYGDADPALTYTADALPNGDSFSGQLTRDAGESFGTYAINQGSLALNTNNYDLNFTGSNLTIDKKTINVAAAAQTKTYGDADPALTYNADALASGDSFSGALTRDAGEGFGTYAINQGSLALNSSYILNYTGSNLAIGKATLTYTANPVSRYFGDANPALTGTVTGFVNGEDLAFATTGTLSFITTATPASTVGSYPINGSGLTAANYDFVQAPANSTAFSITLSGDATLAGLTIDQSTLTPAFSSSQEYYNANVVHDITSFNLSATLGSTYASVVINGEPYTSGSLKNLALHTGQNNFNIAVTAQDGTPKSYWVSIFRAYSTNNLMASLTLSNVTFSPAFDTNTLNYTAAVGHDVTSTDVFGTPVDNAAKVLVYGQDVAQVGAVNVPLQVGDNDVYAASRAENGDERLYKVTVTRAPSSDATLSAIGVSAGTLNTTFTPATHSYSVTVSPYTENIVISPSAAEGRATITFNGNANNPYSGNFMFLSYGNNIATIKVVAEDGSTTIDYTVNVIRKRSSDATLSNLIIPVEGTINEEFNSAQFNYTADVPDSTYTGLSLTIYRGDNTATVKVNGVDVADPLHYIMSLHGGSNTFHIVVTAQDTSATNTYNLVVTRAGQAPPAQSPNADLLSLGLSQISGGTFSYNVNFSYQTLDPVTVPNSVSALRLFLYAAQSAATAKVNGIPVPGTNQELYYEPLNLVVGDNLFNVVVTAEDGVATRTYPIHVTRLPYVNVDLASLKFNTGTLTPAFAAGTTSYTLAVKNTITELNVTPVASEASASILVGSVAVSAGSPTATVTIPFSGYRLRTTVTGADGVTKKNYTVTLNQLAPDPAATNANLSNLVISDGTLSPAFGSATINYTASVGSTVDQLVLTPSVTDPYATVIIDGHAPDGITGTVTIALSTGANSIPVIVTAQDGTTQSYTITVNRAKAAPVQYGLAYVMNPGATFTKIAGTNDFNFSTSVAEETASVTLKLTAADINAVVRLQGTIVPRGAVSEPIALNVGATTILVELTASNSVTKTYAFTVNRAGSSNYGLDYTISPAATFVKVAGSSDFNFTTSVATETASVTIKAKASDPDAVVTVEGAVVAPGAFSDPIPLADGVNIIHMQLTAGNGVTKTYSFAVSRNGASNYGLAYTMSPAATFVKVAGSSDFNFTTSVAPETASVTIKPQASDPTAVVTVEGAVVAPGAVSDPIQLVDGVTTIHMQLTAGNGVTKTYSFAVSRNGSSNYGLTYTMSPAATFVKVAGTSDLNFTTSVAASVSSVTIKAKAADPDAVVMVEGAIVAPGASSAPIPLVDGVTTIHMQLTAGNGVIKTYSFAVSRSGSSDYGLTYTMSPAATFTKVAGTSDLNFTTSVAASVSSVTIKAKASDPDAVVMIEGSVVAPGAVSAPIPLVDGVTIIHMQLTAGNGVIKTYSFAVSRNGSSNYGLTYTMNPAATFVKVAGTSDLNFTTSVAASVSSVTIKAKAADPDAVVMIEGSVVAPGVVSTPIPLAVGITVIHMQLTAGNGVIKTYAFAVSRPEPASIASRTSTIIADDSKTNVSANTTAIAVHQALSPNGDGLNDALVIDGLNAYPDNHLSVMNTAGGLIFETQGYGAKGNVFDGHDKNGTLQKPGTYYYVLQYNDGKTAKRKTGYIIIKY